MTVDHGRALRRRLVDALAVGTLFTVLYPCALILDWQDRKAGIR